MGSVKKLERVTDTLTLAAEVVVQGSICRTVVNVDNKL